MGIRKEYERIAALLRIKFAPALAAKDPEAVEIVMILVLSLLFGWDTPAQVARRLGIPQKEVYGTLKGLNLHDWRLLFACAFDDLAIEALRDAQLQSDSTWSRQQVVLAMDDSVIRRWGQLLSYLGTWWSGQFHRVLLGQDIVMCVLKVGKLVIPADFIILSCRKKDRRNAMVANCLRQIAAKWRNAGIRISRIPVTMDAGYADSDLVKSIRDIGFLKVLTGAKGSYVLHPHRSQKGGAPLRQLLGRNQLLRSPGWGCNERVGFLKGESPTFGKLKVCARLMLGKVRRVFAFGIERVCEIVRVWQSHHWVEEFFKRMKHLLSWGSYQLRGTSGAHASIVLPFLAYYALLILQQRTGSTLASILEAIDQLSRISLDDMLKSWNIEHFELDLAEPDALLK